MDRDARLPAVQTPESIEEFDFARPRLVERLERRRMALRRSAVAVTLLLPPAVVFAVAGKGWVADLVAFFLLLSGPLLMVWDAWDRSVDGRIEVLRDGHRALTGQELPPGNPCLLRRV